MNSIRNARIITAAAVAIAVGWALAGCGEGDPGDAAATPAASNLTTSATPTPGQAAGTAPGQTGTQEPAGDPPPTQGDPGGQGDHPDVSPIEFFRITQTPRCPGGTDVNPIEGLPVTLEWRVTGADEVSISIDGPGIYSTYPAEGGDTYSFGCGGEEGDIQEHTFLLTAVADGKTVTETLVVTATVHERTTT